MTLPRLYVVAALALSPGCGRAPAPEVPPPEPGASFVQAMARECAALCPYTAPKWQAARFSGDVVIVRCDGCQDPPNLGVRPALKARRVAMAEGR